MTKKPHFNPPRSEERLKKSKWQWFLLFLLVFGAWRPVMAQSGAERITLDLHQATMDAFALEIKAQADYTFFYNDSLAKAIEPITLSVTGEPLSSVLDKVLGPKGYTFTIEDKTIVIKKARPLPRGIKSVEVCGFVYDEKRQPMPGVTVQVVGTSVGTASTAGGWFSIALPLVEGKLKFSFVGYKDKEVAFTAESARDTLRVYMEEAVEELDEAIVVAYGETTRRKATGSISVVKAEDIRGIPSVSIETLLQGRVAGLDVTQMSGAPGGGGTAVTIRGYNSLDVEQGRRFSNPLWVVDGVPMNSFTSPITGTNLLSDLNPDMIESIQILKDASSAAIYGSRAANGVIIITTKKGRKNQDATFSVNVSQTWSILPELPTVTTGRAERLFRLEAVKNSYQAYLDPETNRYKYPETLREQYDHNRASLDGNFIPQPYNNNNGTIFQDSLNSFYNNSTNFFPIYYVKGKVTNANIQTYGGSERMTYGIGLGYYNEEGIFRGTGFNRVDLNSSMNVTPVERLNVDLRLNASLSNRKRGTKQGMLNYAPSIETVPGEPYELSSLLPGEGSIAWNSVLDTYKGTKEKNRAVRLRANFKLDYEPIEGLNVSTSLAADYSIERRNYFQPSTLSQDGYSISIGETGVNLMVLNENIISFNRVIKDVHSIGVVAGLSYQYVPTATMSFLMPFSASIVNQSLAISSNLYEMNVSIDGFTCFS